MKKMAVVVLILFLFLSMISVCKSAEPNRSARSPIVSASSLQQIDSAIHNRLKEIYKIDKDKLKDLLNATKCKNDFSQYNEIAKAYWQKDDICEKADYYSIASNFLIRDIANDCDFHNGENVNNARICSVSSEIGDLGVRMLDKSNIFESQCNEDPSLSSLKRSMQDAEELTCIECGYKWPDNGRNPIDRCDQYNPTENFNPGVEEEPSDKT